MSFKAIATISEAEESARKEKATAVATAREAALRAQEEGEALIRDAEKRAAEEARKRGAETDAAAQAESENLSEGVENKKAAMRARAESRLQKASSLIVERIVSG